jgi:hypothetical protein
MTNIEKQYSEPAPLSAEARPADSCRQQVYDFSQTISVARPIDKRITAPLSARTQHSSRAMKDGPLAAPAGNGETPSFCTRREAVPALRNLFLLRQDARRLLAGVAIPMALAASACAPLEQAAVGRTDRLSGAPFHATCAETGSPARSSTARRVPRHAG